MLDVLSYPVSVIMWLWHHVLSLRLSPGSGITWSLSVILLVITLRAVLLIPATAQFRSTRRTQKLQPQIAALRTKYAHNSSELGRRLRQLHSDHGVSVLGGLLSALVQIPVFLGLYHLLTNFTSQLPNGVFDAAEVSSFRHARLWHAPLSAYLSMPSEVRHTLDASLSGADIAAVALPLVILTGLTSFITARHSLRQQGPLAGPAAALSRVCTPLLALFPVIAGVFFAFPIAIALYWFTNSAWTLAQNYLLTRHFDAADTARDAAAPVTRPRYLPPKPGQKPQRLTKHGR